MIAFPKLQVGDPVKHESLAVFPLFAETVGGIDYLLADEAIAGGGIKVEEISEGGSVPELLVDNQVDARVLFLEGEELRGAKQNRVLNASVLVAAKSRTKIPVSCVEQGRWRYKTRHFGSAGSHGSPRLRHVLKKSVLKAALAGSGHRSDQGEVWKEVGRQMEVLGSVSATMAMSDTYEAHSDRVAEYKATLPYIEGATGFAVAVQGKIVSVDLFDKPATCRKVWSRLLSGAIMDALEAKETDKLAEREVVEQIIADLCNASWEQAQPVGAGDEFWAELDDCRHASALTFGDSLVHASLIVAA
jgi:hypothetical protein